MVKPKIMLWNSRRLIEIDGSSTTWIVSMSSIGPFWKTKAVIHRPSGHRLFRSRIIPFLENSGYYGSRVLPNDSKIFILDQNIQNQTLQEQFFYVFLLWLIISCSYRISWVTSTVPTLWFRNQFRDLTLWPCSHTLQTGKASLPTETTHFFAHIYVTYAHTEEFTSIIPMYPLVNL